MQPSNWGAMLPSNVAKWINFDRSNTDWNYEGPASPSMESRQAEGVAYLWNLLSLHGVALLADEVGMGKTFQALGVAALLWKMKPDAKILVVAPNRDICAHWRREYESFVQVHYRDTDHCVKNGVDGGPVQAIQSCWRLSDLADAVETKAGHLYLTTIYSLSGLVPNSEKDSDVNAKAKVNAGKIHDRLKDSLGGHGFDLIIIDEAHYFRNRSGNSQRVVAAQAFFGDPAAPLSKKVLLMTATPSHTHQYDVKNILSYFLKMQVDGDYSALTLMRKYGLRRFRRMKGKDGAYFSKGEYRNEKERPCDFIERPESEMFFALYQKKLVTELGFTRDNKSLLYGFLEGFESVGRNAQVTMLKNQDETQGEEISKKDFSRAQDTELLSRLTSQYFQNFSKLPDHPKYGQLVEQCVPKDLFVAPRDLHEDKHLIFVRRIPSVRELTQRINEAYDNALAAKIFGAWGFSADDPEVRKWRKQNWSRSGFRELLLKRQAILTEEEDYQIEDENLQDEKVTVDEDEQLGSLISDLFVIKSENKNSKGKNEIIGSTDCSNVSLRFRKPESAFAMFLEPSSDYLLGTYDYFYQSQQGGKLRPDYVAAAKDERWKRHNRLTRKMESEHRSHKPESYKQSMATVWSLVYPNLSPVQQNKLQSWSTSSPDIAENFAIYIKTGFLFASPVMVEIYAWFTEFNLSNNVVSVEEKYAGFMKFVEARIKNSLLLSYFKNALDTFEELCGKITDHKLGDWKKGWRVLTSLQNPAWYASGQSGDRQRLILGFNSPFYPTVLVATSVFQEGVNLHLQCTKVHHYGIAGSPGDNEQRVGRVDRLFGKMNELLKVDDLAELEVNYPFLKNSVDEDQVASFIARKFHVEEKMDACTQSTFDKSVELTRENWKGFLRKPVREILAKDSYEAKFEREYLPTSTYVPSDNHHDSDLTSHIHSLFTKILDPNREKLFSFEKNSHYPNALFLVDPVVEHVSGQRHQPIVVEKHFSSQFSALVSGTVYYVSMKSPIANRDDVVSKGADFIQKLGTILPELAARYPLVRLAIDSNSAMSHFYLHVRVDLPVFVKSGGLSILSQDELSMAFQQLKQCSDRLEIELYSGKRDLPAESLKMASLLSNKQHRGVDFGSAHKTSMRNSRWEIVRCADGAIERLCDLIPMPILDKKYPEGGALFYGSVKDDCGFSIKALMLNHQVPFVTFEPRANGCLVSINYPSMDIQPEERELFERWFDYVSSNP